MPATDTASTPFGRDRLRHGGLLLDPKRLRLLASDARPALSETTEMELRRRVSLLEDDPSGRSDFAHYVLSSVCGFRPEAGTWQVSAELSGLAVGAHGCAPALAPIRRTRRLLSTPEWATLAITFWVTAFVSGCYKSKIRNHSTLSGGFL